MPEYHRLTIGIAPMTEYEEQLRRKELEEEISHGSYLINNINGKIYTGKFGYINFQIALEKEVRKIYTAVEES